MPTTNQYLPFGNGSGANTYSYASYTSGANDASRTGGYVAGEADARHINTVLRQVSVAVAGVAKLATDYGALDCLDDGVAANFAAALKSALDVLYIQDLSGLVPYSQFNGSGRQDLSGGEGWQRFPGNLIFQWANVYAGNIGPSGVETLNFTYPQPLDELIAISATMRGNSYASSVYVMDETTTTATVKFNEWGPGVQDMSAQIIVIGRKA